MANYANDGPVDYSSHSGRFPSLQDNGDHYEEEIYFRSVSRSRNDLTSNEDNDNDFQNQVILNNFVDQLQRDLIIYKTLPSVLCFHRCLEIFLYQLHGVD